MKFLKNTLGEYITEDGIYTICRYSKYWAIRERTTFLGGVPTLAKAKEFVEFQYELKNKM